jgi:hypothetical protein
MESEVTDAETDLESTLAEPHFDDEATLLSARRVVPLDEVACHESQTTARFGRGWIYAATVAGALLLGAFVGAAYYSYANRQLAQPVVDGNNINAGIDGLSNGSAQDNEGRAPANTPEVNTTSTNGNPEVIAKQSPPSRPQPEKPVNDNIKPVARRVDVLTFPSNSQLTHEERQAARREAKARKQELERERRRSRDELTRIREIFEGPQRP